MKHDTDCFKKENVGFVLPFVNTMHRKDSSPGDVSYCISRVIIEQNGRIII